LNTQSSCLALPSTKAVCQGKRKQDRHPASVKSNILKNQYMLVKQQSKYCLDKDLNFLLVRRQIDGYSVLPKRVSRTQRERTLKVQPQTAPAYPLTSKTKNFPEGCKC
jgi:hypothetical protein